MATIQDIMDWLNQGAQGDIPGTGGEQPNTGAASQPAQPQPTPAAAMQSQPSPQDYADGIPPDLMPHYQALVQGGVPPQMAHQILTQPQGQQPGQKPGEEKKGGLQGSDAYKAGQLAGTGLEHLFFGAPPTQQGGQAQDHQGLIDMLSSWFSPSPQQSDWSQ